jgi:signal transduction histidine kinase/ligand-binding sensor domain-containing protein
MWRRFYFSILIFFFTVAVLGQNFEMRISNIEMPMNANVPATFSIVKDNSNFIWFGTIDGLYRYDGFNFKIYRAKENTLNSLSNNTIRALAIDKENKLWIGTQGGGLNVLDLKSGKFKYYFYQEDKNSITENNIWALCFDKDENLWIGMDNSQINKLDIKTNEFTVYNFIANDEMPDVTTIIRTIYQDHNGLLWIGTDRKGIYTFDDKTKKTQHFFHRDNDITSIPNNYILSILEEPDKRYFFTTYGSGIFEKDANQPVFSSFMGSNSGRTSSVSNLCYAFIKAAPDVYWIGTEFGLAVRNTQANETKMYDQYSPSHSALTDNRIRTIFKDSNNVYWIGSEAGVDKVVDQHNFKIYQNVPMVVNSLPKGIVRTILKDKNGIIWVGMIDKGLISFDPHSKKYTNFSIESKQRDEDKSFQTSALFEDSKNNLWVGDWDKGLFLFDRKQQKFISVVNTGSSECQLYDNRIQFIREFKPGILWIGTESELIQFDYESKKINRIEVKSSDLKMPVINSFQSEAFAVDKSNSVWLGTWSKGLYQLQFNSTNSNQPKVTAYRFEAHNAGVISSDNVISLHIQHDSLLWIGTFGGGLNCLNLNSHKISHFSTNEGLPNNVIFAIKEDSLSNLWLSTDNGLSMLNYITKQFHNFDKSEGLQDNHFFWGAAFSASDGEMFFGGINGFNSFYPKNIQFDTSRYTIFITGLKVNNLEFSRFTHTTSDTLILPHDSNYIDISFAILDYREPSQTLFKVKMDGVDENWVNVGNQRQVKYSNLAPGKYILNLQAANSDNFWSQKNNILTIFIEAPWYATTFAYIVYLLSFLIFLFTFYRIRLLALSRNNKRLSEMVAIRTKELEMQKEELSNTLAQLSSAQQQLVQTEKMASLGTLVAGIAHEINNPINYIYSGWQVLADILKSLMGLFNVTAALKHDELREVSPDLYLAFKNVDFEFISENIEPVQQSITLGINRTIQIVKSLNTYSHNRLEERSFYRIEEAIDNAILILKSKYKDRIIIHNSLDNLPAVECNPGLINQLFMNIIGNAIDAISSDGDIWIKAYVYEPFIDISIRDNGSGIEEENLNKIFDPFFTTKDVGKGTGLGLYISYQIILAHNGKVNIQSELGHGTTFTISLPINNPVN